MYKDYLKIKGNVVLRHFRDGKLIDERDDHNLIQTLGIEDLGDYLIGTFTGNFNYMGIGTGGVGGDNAALTALVSEVGLDGKAAVTHTILTSRSSTAGVVIFVTTFTMSGSAAISEVGLFKTTPASDMLARQTFADLNLGATDSLQVTWTITIS
jgi:hypothetical protein